MKDVEVNVNNVNNVNNLERMQEMLSSSIKDVELTYNKIKYLNDAFKHYEKHIEKNYVAQWVKEELDESMITEKMCSSYENLINCYYEVGFLMDEKKQDSKEHIVNF